MKAFFKAIGDFFANLFKSKDPVSTVTPIKVIPTIINTRNHGPVTLPATGKFVCESHYAIKGVTYNGRTFPSSANAQIDSHLNDSISALKKWFPNVTKEEIYNNSWERQWTPANDGGANNDYGQGSLGDDKPSVDEEIWQGNMYFVKNPGKNERFLITNPKNGKKCVIQMAYEQGPGSTAFLGGVVPEVQWCLDADNSTQLKLEKVADLTPLGPTTGVVETKPTEPTQGLGKFTEPEFVTVKGVKFVDRGDYKTPSGKFSGLVVHYTVSGRTESSAKGVIGWLRDQGYGCMVMDENGKIYIPEGFDVFKSWGYHAGVSKWAGRSSVSDVFAGMEICNWGLNSKVGPYREVKNSQGYVVSGKYQAYTEAQEKALTNFILWAKSKNPEFKLDNVVGHDELRREAGKPGDKADPGGSLSMTMPKYREYLKKLV